MNWKTSYKTHGPLARTIYIKSIDPPYLWWLVGTVLLLVVTSGFLDYRNLQSSTGLRQIWNDSRI